MSGKLIVISAPSGAGKTSIVKNLLNLDSNLEFSVSACTRPRRNDEIDGVDYYFISVEEFKKKISNNEFLEWEEVYPECYYGTLKSEVEKIWAKGKHVVFDVDVKGGLNIKKKYPDITLSVFIRPPDIECLRQRLLKRNTETMESIEKRITKAKYEMTFEQEFDLVVINDILEKATEEVYKAVLSFIS